MRETIEVGILKLIFVIDSWNENKEARTACSIKRFEDTGTNYEVARVYIEMIWKI